MKILTAIVLTVFLATAGTPSDNLTGTIKGTIVDDTTDAPLAYANVVVIGTTMGAMTLKDGHFEIANVKPGTYPVKVLMMGYKPVERKNVEVRAGEVVELVFKLTKTRVSRCQMINVVGGRELVDVTGSQSGGADTGYQVKEMPVDNVTEALALKTGIIKAGDELHARGGRSGHIHVQPDGVPVDDPLGDKETKKSRSTRDKWAGSRGVPTPAGVDTPKKKKKVKSEGGDNKTTSVLLHNESRCNAPRPKPPPPKPRPAECRPVCHRSHCWSPHRVCRVAPRWRCGPHQNESYAPIIENAFCCSVDKPVSTFSVDVDAASYANTRRFLYNSQLPPRNAVRIEELVNYFSYDYPEPDGEHPFSITTEVASCPWDLEHRLVHIGLQGRRISMDHAPPNNLVFLIDVSGSMRPRNKLPLLKSSFRLLVDHLRPQDRVAIVVYAGAAGLVLPSTTGENKDEILDAIGWLRAGGSTAGGAGIQLAYEIAQENYDPEANNRVILATDGDFNVGASSDEAMVELIESKRDEGVFLTVLGFGEGNLKDSKMEKIADHGNGHFAYIDNLLEAKKVLINELGATLLTIAKDVKIQIEFNPVKVESYRLIGYENRLLNREDFDDDTKDAGEIGAGHSVTALYEVVPADARADDSLDNDLKYVDVRLTEAGRNNPEILTVKFRYKPPNGDESILLTRVVVDEGMRFEEASPDFRFAAAVAEFGMLLRDSQFRGDASFAHVAAAAREARGEDKEGYRGEFVRMVEMCDLIVAQR
ncbi:MAG: von Willebrand factor type A domain-containing protein [Candidatus Latescibacterota bacterium]|nr:MAG: von Willebrand factor type A domain-containing protein [Candidatus Latescibacterota bacterium]